MGLMGAGDAVIARGGEVIGVISRSSRPGAGSHGVHRTARGGHDATRKQMMMDSRTGSSPCRGLRHPRGAAEVVTWAQLNYHRKPVALYNVAGFYDYLVAFNQHAVDQGFVREELRHLIEVGETRKRSSPSRKRHSPRPRVGCRWTEQSHYRLWTSSH